MTVISRKKNLLFFFNQNTDNSHLNEDYFFLYKLKIKLTSFSPLPFLDSCSSKNSQWESLFLNDYPHVMSELWILSHSFNLFHCFFSFFTAEKNTLTTWHSFLYTILQNVMYFILDLSHKIVEQSSDCRLPAGICVTNLFDCPCHRLHVLNFVIWNTKTMMELNSTGVNILHQIFTLI